MTPTMPSTVTAMRTISSTICARERTSTSHVSREGGASSGALAHVSGGGSVTLLLARARQAHLGSAGWHHRDGYPHPGDRLRADDGKHRLRDGDGQHRRHCRDLRRRCSVLRKRKRRTLSKTYKCNHDKRDLHERDPDERGQHERGQHERGEREQPEQREDESAQRSRTKSESQRGEDEAVDENDDADDAGRDHGDEDDQQPHVRARENKHTAREQTRRRRLWRSTARLRRTPGRSTARSCAPGAPELPRWTSLSPSRASKSSSAARRARTEKLLRFGRAGAGWLAGWLGEGHAETDGIRDEASGNYII